MSAPYFYNMTKTRRAELELCAAGVALTITAGEKVIHQTLGLSSCVKALKIAERFGCTAFSRSEISKEDADHWAKDPKGNSMVD